MFTLESGDPMPRSVRARERGEPVPPPPALRPASGRRLAALVAAAILTAGTARSVQAASLVVDFRQGANNETNGTVTGLGNVHWINSIIQSSNSAYYEGMGVPQRVLFDNLPASPTNTYHLLLRHQSTKAGVHAYDFLTSWEQAVATAAAAGITLKLNPCGNEIGPPGTLQATCNALYSGPNFLTTSVPDDPYISQDGSTQQRINAFEAIYGNRTVKIYGNSPITAMSMTFLGHQDANGTLLANGADTGDSYAAYDLQWTSTSSRVFVALAGHLAVTGPDGSGLNWGPGNGSSQIAGGPYHFKLDGLQTVNANGTRNFVSLGSQDNQIKGADILIPPPSCGIDGPAPLCSGQTGLTYTATTDGYQPTFQWAISGSGSIAGSTTGSSVSVTAGASGSFTVSVTITAQGKSTTCTKTVAVPSPVVASSVATPILCAGGDSTVTVGASGGTAPYSGTGTFTVKAGTHSFTITDANGCSTATSVTVGQPAPLVASSDATPILCNGGDSTVTVGASGGTAPYSGTGTFTVTAGTHSFTVTDANGCSTTTSVTVGEPALLVASSDATPILCNGGDSTVTVGASGGTAPYTGTGTFTVKAGTHSFTVTDANGCTTTTSVTVGQPAPLVASSDATPILCNGGDSTVTVGASGGTAPYTGTGTFTVKAGTHSFTLTDANGCTTTTSVTVGEPAPLVASSEFTPICPGGTSTVTVTASGGTAPYTGTGTFDVQAGTHTYTVTDANGCSATTTVEVTENPTPTCSLSAPAVLPPCGSQGNTLSVASDGVSFSWSVTSGSATITNGDGTPTITYTAGNGPSTFEVEVTSADGCTSTCSVTFGCQELAEFCTLTQGFWGSAAAASGSFNGVAGANLLSCLLDGNGVTVGIPGTRSLTLLDADCVMSRLPATGTPTTLPEFAAGGSPDRLIGGPDCNTIDPAMPLDLNGHFQNVLLGQTITLSLNLRFDPLLGAWQLPASFTTVAALAGSDGVVGEPLSCTPDGADPNDDVADLDPLTCAAVSRTIPAPLVGMTVSQLLALANDALAGLDTAGVTLAEINQAVSAVNEGFDKCRFLGSCPAPLSW